MTAPITQVIVALAVAKVVIALTAIAWDSLLHESVVQIGAPLNTLWVSALLVSMYATTGLLLPRLSRSDARARALGAFLLLVATSFSPVLIRSGHQFGELSVVALRSRIDVFLPAYLWMFVRDFPIRASLGRTSVWPSRLAIASAVIGGVLFLANLIVDLAGVYWPALLALMIPAAPALLERARYVGPGDRRRVRFFVLAMSGGLLPIAIDIVLRAGSQTWRDLASEAPWNWTPVLVLAALLTVPAATAYSVIVDRVLDLRLMARAALQYALARLTIILIIMMPVAWATWSTFEARTQTLTELVARRPMPIAAAFFSLAVVLPTRRRLLHSLDRQFFREHYDADFILGGLVEASRGAQSAPELAQLLATEIDRALHPDRIAVLVRRSDLERFEAMGGTSRSLPTTSMLATILGSSDAPVEIEPLNTKSILRRIDPDTVVWLADNDFRMLVPLRGASGGLRGFIALGEKKSELSYSGRDHSMLKVIGATGGLCLDAHLASENSDERLTRDESRSDVAAKECPVCGLVYQSDAVSCRCGAALTESNIPEVLAGKFQIDQRIGAGGMGVVYRATDLDLERTVAIKALRGHHSRDAWRLRREARAMALITHPNLALVFELEFWFGRPLLVVEYLAGGTLADRLASRRALPEEKVASIGHTLARVLGVLHGSGMLHRDIKPANIGFTGEGVVKLLDFGLSRHFHVTGTQATESIAESAVEINTADGFHTPIGHVIGTPAYMSREALSNEKPDNRFDLWSLAVTLFETLVGVNPYRDRTVKELLAPGPAPDPRDFAAGCSAKAAVFFSKALAPRLADRPASAEAFATLIDSHFSR